MVAITMNFIEAAERVGLAVRADDVAGGKDFELAPAVLALDQLRANDKLTCEDRIAGDQFLGQLQVITGLRLIVRQNEAVVAPVGWPRQ